MDLVESTEDAAMWTASGGVMGQASFSFAEKVRQARQLDQLLEGFSSGDDDEGDQFEGDLEAACEFFENSNSILTSTVKAAAKAAASASFRRGESTLSDAASDASTRLESASGASSSVPSSSRSSLPQSSAGSSASSSLPQSSAGSVSSFGSGVLDSISNASPPSSRGSSAVFAPLSPHRPLPRQQQRGPNLLPPLLQQRRQQQLSPSAAYEEGAEGVLEALHDEGGGAAALAARPRSGLRWRAGGSRGRGTSAPRGGRAGAALAAAHEASYAY